MQSVSECGSLQNNDESNHINCVMVACRALERRRMQQEWKQLVFPEIMRGLPAPLPVSQSEVTGQHMPCPVTVTQHVLFMCCALKQVLKIVTVL